MTIVAQEIRTFLQINPLTAQDIELLEPILADETIVGSLISLDVALSTKIAALAQVELSAAIIDDLFFFAQLLHNHGLTFATMKPYILGIIAEQNNVPFIEIYTREPVSPETAKKMEQLISAQLFSDHPQCNFLFACDPDIIGGFRVCHRDTVWDYSLEAQLTAFHQQFISL